MTIRELGERWLEERREEQARGQFALSTIYGNGHQLANHVYPAFGTIAANTLTGPRIADWIKRLRKKDGDAPCASTLRNIVSTLKQMYEDALALEWIEMPKDANPVDHPAVSRALPRTSRRGRREMVLSLEVVQRLLDDPQVPLRRRVRYALAFSTGMRDGEIAGLTWENVDLDAPVPFLRVEQAFQLHRERDERGKLLPRMGALKTEGSHRTLPLHSVAVAALREWRAEGWELDAARAFSPTLPVFVTTGGRPLRVPSAAFLRVDLQAIGAPTARRDQPFEFHDARRSFITWLNIAGVGHHDVQRLVGHSGGSVTSRSYTATDLPLLRGYVERVGLLWNANAGCQHGEAAQ